MAAVATFCGYNADGDQTTRTVNGQSWTLAYDYDDQLTGVTGTGGGAATAGYGLDALGRRPFRAAGGVTTREVFDGGVSLAQYDGSGAARAIINGSQAVVDNLNFDGSGVLTGASGTTASPYQWGAGSGYRSDGGGGGLVQCGARYYDPYTGRFISRDTDLSQSPYAYCDGDPVNNTDPSGHRPTDAHDALLAAIAALANGEEVAGFSGAKTSSSNPTVSVGRNPPSVTITSSLNNGTSISGGLGFGNPNSYLPTTAFGNYTGNGYKVSDTYSFSGSNNVGVTLNLGLGSGASLSGSGNIGSGHGGVSGGGMLTVTLKF